MSTHLRSSWDGLACVVGAALWLSVALTDVVYVRGDEPKVLSGSKLLDVDGDLSARMVAEIDQALTRATAESVAGRSRFWARDFESGNAYLKSVEPNRQRLRKIIGAVEERTSPVRMEFVSGSDRAALLAESKRVRVYAVRWTAWEGVDGEGLLLEPTDEPVARVVALPDADQTPEMLAGLAPGIDPRRQFARRLAEAGCQVIVPVLVDRRSTWSGNPEVAMTNQTHREWVWRPAYELGRHIIGFEVQKVEAAVEWLRSRDREGAALCVGVAGYGEGGMIALYTAAVDQRVEAALVSGYFDAREALSSEPIYRSVFGLLREFGDAELASLVAPRGLVIEHCDGPRVDGPPAAEGNRRATAAPGRLVPPVLESVQREVERARQLVSLPNGPAFVGVGLVVSDSAAGPGSDEACRRLLKAIGVDPQRWERSTERTEFREIEMDADARQQRQVNQLIEHCQRLLRQSEKTRAAYWKDAKPESAEKWPDATKRYRELLWNDVLGRLPDPTLPANPRTRLREQHEKWTTWEVLLDVWPDVSAWGYLLVPAGIEPGEQRPVVVCQHGLEGLPESTINEDRASRDWRAYRAFAHQLAARGFVVYCPHNPYRGETAFRQLQRKANPLGLTLYSFIIGQHQQTLAWLGSLPFVDAERIGFYGLSYGGTSAVRIPALLDGYALSICSAAFNDWASKVVSNEFPSAYVFTREYDHFTFNLASTFNNAELAALIAPRPFMVERGHDDAVAPDEWVAAEYAQVRRLYARLGIPERTEIEFFLGGHEIHGQETFRFLHRHLDWPEPVGR